MKIVIKCEIVLNLINKFNTYTNAYFIMYKNTLSYTNITVYTIKSPKKFDFLVKLNFINYIL